MFGLFQQVTPQYEGSAQPTSSSGGGTLGFLNALIASPVVPPYATADRKPTAPTGGNFEPVTLTSMPSMSEQVTTQCACVQRVVTQETASEQLAAVPACSVPLPFAIVIQRPQE